MAKRTGRISLAWDDPEEAEAVAQVLYSAAHTKKGMVRDHGFLEDATEMMRQIDEARQEDALDWAGGD